MTLDQHSLASRRDVMTLREAAAPKFCADAHGDGDGDAAASPHSSRSSGDDLHDPKSRARRGGDRGVTSLVRSQDASVAREPDDVFRRERDPMRARIDEARREALCDRRRWKLLVDPLPANPPVAREPVHPGVVSRPRSLALFDPRSASSSRSWTMTPRRGLPDSRRSASTPSDHRSPGTDAPRRSSRRR